MVSLTHVKSFVLTPIPSCISYMWGFGSLLGMNLMVQIVSGMVLAFNYEASCYSSFDSVVHICQDVQSGWLFRFIHANGASFFFTMMYIHIGRGMYYGGFKNGLTWVSGVTILLVSMGTAFLGYVLPWGQMSLWGATVITNLMSAIPYVGSDLTIWMWGGFSVGGPTLTRFFSLHFLLPFGVMLMVVLHMMTLHNQGSSNPLGVSEQADKVPFHPYYTLKDLVGFIVFLLVFSYVVLLVPDVFMDPDNFVVANPLVTPPHIQPEWYFLFAYAILRSIPSKLGGVIGLVSSILVLYLGVLKFPTSSRSSVVQKAVVVVFFMVFLLLTWAGAMPAEYPLVEFSKALSLMYFLLVVIWLCL